MKKTLALITIATVLYSCSSSSNSSSKDSVGVDASKAVVRKPDSTQGAAKDTTAKTDSQASSVINNKTWTYHQEVDKMTSKTNYFAAINATEELQFESPYDGGSTPTLTVRNSGNGNEVVLNISKGQFTNVDGGVQIKFDSAQPVKFSASEPSDGSSDVIFINNASKLIKKIKASSKIIIQAEFYESGVKTMEFNVAGLKWEH